MFLEYIITYIFRFFLTIVHISAFFSVIKSELWWSYIKNKLNVCLSSVWVFFSIGLCFYYKMWVFLSGRLSYIDDEYRRQPPPQTKNQSRPRFVRVDQIVFETLRVVTEKTAKRSNTFLPVSWRIQSDDAPKSPCSRKRSIPVSVVAVEQ